MGWHIMKFSGDKESYFRFSSWNLTCSHCGKLGKASYFSEKEGSGFNFRKNEKILWELKFPHKLGSKALKRKLQKHHWSEVNKR